MASAGRPSGSGKVRRQLDMSVSADGTDFWLPLERLGLHMTVSADGAEFPLAVERLGL
jgi:hypothetical protein